MLNLTPTKEIALRPYQTDAIDALLDKVDSKYQLVIYAAKRARQINDYYNQLGDGILEYVGPLVEPGMQEKPLSIALREINEGLLTHTAGEAVWTRSDDTVVVLIDGDGDGQADMEFRLLGIGALARSDFIL